MPTRLLRKALYKDILRLVNRIFYIYSPKGHDIGLNDLLFKRMSAFVFNLDVTILAIANNCLS